MITRILDALLRLLQNILHYHPWTPVTMLTLAWLLHYPHRTHIQHKKHTVEPLLTDTPEWRTASL